MDSQMERVSKLLGFNPQELGVADAFKQALDEVKKERADAAKAKVKEKLVRLLDLQKQREEVKKKFAADDKKFEKEVGKLLAELEGSSSGASKEEADE